MPDILLHRERERKREKWEEEGIPPVLPNSSPHFSPHSHSLLLIYNTTFTHGAPLFFRPNFNSFLSSDILDELKLKKRTRKHKKIAGCLTRKKSSHRNLWRERGWMVEPSLLDTHKQTNKHTQHRQTETQTNKKESICGVKIATWYSVPPLPSSFSPCTSQNPHSKLLLLFTFDNKITVFYWKTIYMYFCACNM